MSSDVVLSSALRTNLLSLQKTQSLIDSTQNKLATGLKVNSALDDASSFFASKALNNRASDLGRLLDGLGQSIRTVEAADNGITAISNLAEQASAIATQALDAVSGDSSAAGITGNVDLSGTTDLTSLSGIEDDDAITFTINDADGNAVTLSNGNGTVPAAGVVQIDTADSIDQLITNINDLTNSATGEQALTASLNSDGQLEIKSNEGGDLRIEFSTGGLPLAESLGLDSLAVSETNGATDVTAVTVSGTAALESNVFYKATGSAAGLADASTLLSAADDASGTNYFAGEAGDDIIISVDGGAAVEVGDVTTATFQSVVDSINSNTSLNTKIQASFDDTTGQLSIQSLGAETVQIGVKDDATNGASADFGFGLKGATATAATTETSTESIAFGAAASELTNLQNDYNEILSQIDGLVEDAGYRGTNLLNGDDLVTNFNEDRSNSLTTEGADFTSGGLGIEEGSFRGASSITKSISDVSNALESIRSFGSSISNDLAVIQNRQDFTSSTINTLQSGADDLTLADTNEEGANLLALQTRQALGTTALSLASQSQQSVLRLF